MKKCSYCGKEYPDEATVCVIDSQPLVSEDAGVPPTKPKQTSVPPATNPVKPALMTRLRSYHLYLGCIFAPMLLFFTISGIWQTLGLTNTPLLRSLSSIHTHATKGTSARLDRYLIALFTLMMAVAFIFSTALGIIMALKYGKSRRAAVWCLTFGVVCPLVLILIALI